MNYSINNLKNTSLPPDLEDRLFLIAAISKNNVIGYEGHIPWYYPEDLRYFKDLTISHPIIMGRSTFDSIVNKNKKPLIDRLHIVLTKKSENRSYPSRNVIFLNNIFDFFKSLNDYIISYPQFSFSEIWIIGGQQIYQLLLPYCTHLYITRVNEEHKGDTFFPEIDPKVWRLKSQKNYENRPLTFEIYIKEKEMR